MTSTPGRPMWGTELRGVLVIAAVIAAIAFAWNRIENRTFTTDTRASTTTATTTTTTIASTTTTTPAQGALAVCERSQTFVDTHEALPPEAGDGDIAILAREFWSDVLELAPPDLATEIAAVVGYYESYLATGTPFDFDTPRIILEGDKEKLEQLLTRPAPGLETARGAISFGCGVDVPDQPKMSARAFDDLEDRLLGRTRNDEQ